MSLLTLHETAMGWTGTP